MWMSRAAIQDVPAAELAASASVLDLETSSNNLDPRRWAASARPRAGVRPEVGGGPANSIVVSSGNGAATITFRIAVAV